GLQVRGGFLAENIHQYRIDFHLGGKGDRAFLGGRNFFRDCSEGFFVPQIQFEIGEEFFLRKIFHYLCGFGRRLQFLGDKFQVSFGFVGLSVCRQFCEQFLRLFFLRRLFFSSRRKFFW